MDSIYNPKHLDDILKFLLLPLYAGSSKQADVEKLDNILFKGRVEIASIIAYIGIGWILISPFKLLFELDKNRSMISNLTLFLPYTTPLSKNWLLHRLMLDL